MPLIKLFPGDNRSEIPYVREFILTTFKDTGCMAVKMFNVSYF